MGEGNPEVCEKHEALEKEIEKGKFIRRIFGSKTLISVIGTAILFLISWGIWVTNHTYSRASEQSSMNVTLEELSKDIEEIKREMKDRNKKFDKNQEKMIDILLNIQKGQKELNDNKKYYHQPR